MRLLNLMLILTLATAAFAADATGKWVATLEGDNGSMELTFNFKVDGDKLTGTVTGPQGEIEITEGKVDGDNITFTVDTGDMKIVHKGTISGDEMKLKVDFGENSMEMTAKRVKT